MSISPQRLTSATRQDKGYNCFIVFAASQCNSPLGMESGQISNMQIKASSSYMSGNWEASQGRLNHNINGWTPAEDTTKEWIQVGQGTNWRIETQHNL